MKPAISIDERGILLHVTDDTGEGIAVPLDPERIAAGVKTAIQNAKSEDGKRRILRALGSLVSDLLEAPKP